MKIRLHAGARADLREGRNFYKERSPLAAVLFLETIEEAVVRITEAPERHPLREHGTREYVLPGRFPYTIVYRIRERDLLIVAVAHQSREPGYWQDR
ncbi:MAG TPA: type II toxin-antitoxin system RelE/ParE family toxin [Thermoanaerobaculia bacterium]|jgi:plasmid stabilization system protein ParE